MSNPPLSACPIHVQGPLPGPKGKAAIATSIKDQSPSLIHVYPLMVDEASGCMVRDIDGNVFLDCQAGVAACSTGHSHPKVAEAIAAQARRLVHICGTDFHYPGYGQMCSRLATYAKALQRAAGQTPTDWKAFLTNSGTEGVEAAIKLARHHTGRSHLIAFRGGFHGRSMGALSLTASKTKYKRRFGPLLPGVHHATYGDLDSIEKELFARLVAPDDVAAIFVEPVLGEGGYVVPDPEFLRGLRRICDQHGILLVFDEVQSGMGRTGTIFAAEHSGVVPDIFVLAKGIASGMPIGAMLARDNVMTWGNGTHGSTCGGNPVCIAAAMATMDLLDDELLANAKARGLQMKKALSEALDGNALVKTVRGVGLMLGIEFSSAGVADTVGEACYQKGLLVLGCGDRSIRMSPPLTISEAQCETAVRIFAEAIQKVAQGA